MRVRTLCRLQLRSSSHLGLLHPLLPLQQQATLSLLLAMLAYWQLLQPALRQQSQGLPNVFQLGSGLGRPALTR
jgi:hypothetical protein